MTMDEKVFLQENDHHFVTASVGYVRNLDEKTAKGFEQIYKNRIDSTFVLTNWCGACRLDMVNRVKAWYDSELAKEVVAEPQIEPAPKKTARKK